MKLREKVELPRNTVFFQCFVTPEGREVGSIKRRVRRRGDKHTSKSKCTQHSMSDHCWKLTCRKSASQFRTQNGEPIKKQNKKKHTHVPTTFGCSICSLCGRCKGFCTLPKVASLGHLKKICKDTCRFAGAVQETSSSKMLGGQDMSRR